MDIIFTMIAEFLDCSGVLLSPIDIQAKQYIA